MILDQNLGMITSVLYFSRNFIASFNSPISKYLKIDHNPAINITTNSNIRKLIPPLANFNDQRRIDLRTTNPICALFLEHQSSESTSSLNNNRFFQEFRFNTLQRKFNSF